MSRESLAQSFVLEYLQDLQDLAKAEHAHNEFILSGDKGETAKILYKELGL